MVRLLIISAAFFFASNAMAADCGVFKVVKGKVNYKEKGKDKFKPARKNRKVCQGYTVKTEADGRAKIEMADKNEINVSPDTELIIESYQSNQKAVLNVINGKVRSDVKQKYNDTKQSHYRVKTKSAVAGVRGTEFLASYNQATNEARVVTFEGEVAVGQFNGENFVPKVTVKPGQFTSNSPGTDPHPAKDVPPAEFAQMDQESRVDDSGANKQPASTNQQEKKPRDDKSDKQEPKADKEPGDKKTPTSRSKGPSAKGPGAPGPNDGGIAENGDGSDGILGNGNPGEELEADSGGDRDIASIDGGDGGMDNLLPPPDLSEGPSIDDFMDERPKFDVVNTGDVFNQPVNPVDNNIIQDGVINTTNTVNVIIQPCLPGQCAGNPAN